jgi:hypothetical protein
VLIIYFISQNYFQAEERFVFASVHLCYIARRSQPFFLFNTVVGRRCAERSQQLLEVIIGAIGNGVDTVRYGTILGY